MTHPTPGQPPHPPEENTPAGHGVPVTVDPSARRPLRGRRSPKPGTGHDQKSRTQAGKAPARPAHAQRARRRPARRRSGSSRSAPQCPSTAAARQPSGCPSSGNRCRQGSAHRPERQAVDDVVTDIITDPVYVPARPAQQALHPIRDGFTGVLGQRPAVLRLQTCNQPTGILPRPSPRLGPNETARHTLMQDIQLIRDQVNHHTNMIDYRSSKRRCRTKRPGIKTRWIPPNRRLAGCPWNRRLHS
jgi:hypothetical protein